MNVPLKVLPTNPKAGYLAHKDQIDAAIHRVLDSGWYILGQEVTAFEKEFAGYVGVTHGVGTGSGTDALELALRTCGIGLGDEVITVSHTAVATVAAIELAGATPVLVDIDPVTFTLDPAALAGALTRRTRAVVPVHLYGHPAPMDAICRFADQHGLRVIEDCAQSHGAMLHGRKTGAWGHMAAFSFYPTKNLGALGDGGIVVTNDPDLAQRARELREYGWRERYISAEAGLNTRLDEIQAAILRAKLPHLDAENQRRRDLAGYYSEHLPGADVELPLTRERVVHCYHQYVVRSPRRDALRDHLRASGVGALIHYPAPVHQQPAYEGRLGASGSLPQTERAVREILSLPMFPEMTVEQAACVVDAIRAFAAA